MEYQKILIRSKELIETLTGDMERCGRWSDEEHRTFNHHEKDEAKYILTQVKALIREQDKGSPFLDLCAQEDTLEDPGQIYHQYILILEAFNNHLEAFID